MFVLETIQSDGISQLSYLVGDTKTGHAAVIDPRTDVDVYIDLARKHGLSITHVFETHIHADFVSGSRSLAERVGTAQIFLSIEQSDYEFTGTPLKDQQQFDFGSFTLTARHTPGHTPEHMSFEICEAKNADRIWGVFTGDSLFVGSAGRPDLLGSGQTDVLAQKQFETLYDYYLELEDHVLIYPCHGAGSACGADISDRLVSTIGYERRTNDFLRCHDFAEFENLVVGGAPPVPAHYPILKKINAAGPEIMEHLPTIPALPPQQFKSVAREPGVTIIDTRSMLAFGGGHIEGAINIEDRPELSNWVGEMFDPEQKLLLVVDDESKIDEVQRLIVRTGHSLFAGYLAGGMKAWETSAMELVTLPQWSIYDLREQMASNPKLTVLDARSPDEFDAGHIPNAMHYYVAEMRNRIDGLDKDQPYVTYCASGYRASLASSLMQARGFKNVANVTGSCKAWEAAGFPVEQPKQTANAS